MHHVRRTFSTRLACTERALQGLAKTVPSCFRAGLDCPDRSQFAPGLRAGSCPVRLSWRRPFKGRSAYCTLTVPRASLQGSRGLYRSVGKQASSLLTVPFDSGSCAAFVEARAKLGSSDPVAMQQLPD